MAVRKNARGAGSPDLPDEPAPAATSADAPEEAGTTPADDGSPAADAAPDPRPTVDVSPQGGEPDASAEVAADAGGDTNAVPAAGDADAVAGTDAVPPDGDTQPVPVDAHRRAARAAAEPPALADTQPVVLDAPTPAAPAALSAERERELLLERLTALEAENAHLRAASGVPGSGPVTTPVGAVAERPRRRWGRTAAAVVLIVLGALLAPVAVTVTWAKETITNTDRYLATVGPLVDDPVIQQAVTNRLTGAIVDAINLDQLVAQGTAAVADLGLPPRVADLVQGLDQPIINAATGFIRTQVNRIVTSDAFSTAWKEANRSAQQQLVAVMRGDPDAIASIDSNGTLSVDLTTVIDAVKQSLADRGFTIVNSLPTINASFPLVENADLVRLKNAYQALDVLGTWLPWVVVVLLAAGIMCAYHRSRAVMAAGLAFAGAMLLTGLAIGIGRSLYVNSLPATIQRRDAALDVYDQFVSFLKVAIRTGFVLGIVVAIVAFLAGGSAAAVAVRGAYTRSTAWVRGIGDSHGVGTGAVGVWLDEQRVLIRVVVAIGAALALVLAGHLTPKYVLGVAIVALLVLGLVQLLSRPSDDTARRGI